MVTSVNECIAPRPSQCLEHMCAKLCVDPLPVKLVQLDTHYANSLNTSEHSFMWVT